MISIFDGVLLGATLVAGALVVWFTQRTGISPMPSNGPARHAMLKGLGDLASGTIYDLGSGWGGLAIAAARAYPKASVVGFELSPVPWLYASLVGRLLGLKNLRFRRQDFFENSLTDGAVLLCYLYPGGMTRLAQKLEVEGHKGQVLVSSTFRMPGWVPSASDELTDLYRTHVYKYDVGEHVKAESASA